MVYFSVEKKGEETMTGQRVSEDANGTPIDILLVDDDEADIKITLRAFGKEIIKNNVFSVRDGQAALDFVNHRGPYQHQEKYPRPDLILLDINMPKMNGFEVLKKLKSAQETDCIPVVMLTSSQNPQDVMQCFKNGAASYIPKPVTYEELLQMVNVFNFYWRVINKLPDGKKRSR